MLMQHRNTSFDRTLWIWHCGHDVVSTLQLQDPWYSVRWIYRIYYPTLRQCWHNVVNLTWISALQHRCQYNIHSTSWVEFTNQILQMLTKYAWMESQTRRLSICFPIPINFTFIHLQIKTSRLLSLVKAADFLTTKNKIKLKLLSF